jgi:hypothetical protein
MRIIIYCESLRDNLGIQRLLMSYVMTSAILEHDAYIRRWYKATYALDGKSRQLIDMMIHLKVGRHFD